MLGDATSGYPSLVAIISFLGGIQLLSTGIVGEYVGKTYLETKQRPVYLAEEVLESPVGVSQPLNTRLAEASHVKAI